MVDAQELAGRAAGEEEGLLAGTCLSICGCASEWMRSSRATKEIYHEGHEDHEETGEYEVAWPLECQPSGDWIGSSHYSIYRALCDEAPAGGWPRGFSVPSTTGSPWGSPPRAPTDPYVQDYRIRFLQLRVRCTTTSCTRSRKSWPLANRAIRGRFVNMESKFWASVMFPSHGLVTRHPFRFFLPSAGSPRDHFPGFIGTMRVL